VTTIRPRTRPALTATLLTAGLLTGCLPLTQQQSPTTDAAPWRVTHVVDGDTVDVRHTDGTTERVRVIGIDTPERDECGYQEASAAMTDLVLDRAVTLTPGARDDRDRYDRLLRYVDVDGQDAGLSLIQQGLAVARYDSRDGHGAHTRERTYVTADDAVPHLCG
jgi:micrococcal nuclease